MESSEMGSEGWRETNDTIWTFLDSMDVSRFEKFGLPDSTLYRLAALQRNAGAFGLGAEEIASTGSSGCRLYLYGRKFAHRITVDGSESPPEIELATCELDQAEAWTPRFEGRDTVGCWYYLLRKIVDAEDIGALFTESIFEVPR
jgi:hypothetical protein